MSENAKVPTKPLSKRALAAIAASDLVDLAHEDAAERILAVHGCSVVSSRR